MEVILAKSAGFCFGVKRAVDTVYEQIESGDEIYTYGPIIHNEEVVKDLERKGVKVLESDVQFESAQRGTVVIRSHGVEKSVCDKIESKGLKCVDATCPFVKKIHRIVAQKSQEGEQIVIEKHLKYLKFGHFPELSLTEKSPCNSNSCSSLCFFI